MAFQFMVCRGLRSSLFFSSLSSVGLPSFFSAGFQAGPSVRDGALYDSGGGAKPGRGKVTATAAADSTKSGSATVSVETPTGLGTSQITVTATARGGKAHGDLVTLIVQ